MPALCDVNVLLAVGYEAHVHHRAALDWLGMQDDLEVILCRNTQLGLLRLLCNPAVMGKHACTLEQAWNVYDTFVNDARFDFNGEPEDLEVYLRQYTTSRLVSPKLWQDAYLAAFTRAAKLRLVTFDRGFQQFTSLRLTLLPDAVD